MVSFVKLLKDSNYQEQLALSLIVAGLLVIAFNAYLDLWKVKHERIVKVVSLGFLLFSYQYILWKYKLMNRGSSL